MRDVRVTTGLAVLAVVMLVGVGACRFDSSDRGTGAAAPVGVVENETGAGEAIDPVKAAPTPTNTEPTNATPTGTVTSNPGPASAAPNPATTGSGPSQATVEKAAKPFRGCPQGERQREVETYLVQLGGFGPVTVDGQQSAEDCAAIKKFQRRYGIQPAEGRAGPTTYDVARRLAKTDVSKCKAGKGTTFCVNLTLQTVWAMRDGKVVMPPTVTRTGMAGGYQTPAGTFTINYRNVKEWSRPYKVWLPYWQHFVDGMGFHETTTYIHDMSIGSHGCVNVLPVDARKLWELGKVGTKVYLFGRRPGT